MKRDALLWLPPVLVCALCVLIASATISGCAKPGPTAMIPSPSGPPADLPAAPSAGSKAPPGGAPGNPAPAAQAHQAEPSHDTGVFKGWDAATEKGKAWQAQYDDYRNTHSKEESVAYLRGVLSKDSSVEGAKDIGGAALRVTFKDTHVPGQMLTLH